MKRFFYFLLTFLYIGLESVCQAFAQDNNLGKRLQFVYIDHEVTTPTNVLNQRITQRYYDVVEFPNQEALILYLSNGRRSPMAFVNLKEYLNDVQLERYTVSGLPRDTEDAFKGVLEAMNTANSHTVEARIDMDNILNILERLDVFDENGRLNFKSLRFDFYVGPNFWSLRNNEKIIARLYSVLQQGLQDADKEKVTFNVLKPAGIQFDYIEGEPFGSANLDGINDKLRIMDY